MCEGQGRAVQGGGEDVVDGRDGSRKQSEVREACVYRDRIMICYALRALRA